MNLYEGITILNLVICLYLVYTWGKIDLVIEELVEGFNELWEDSKKDRK